MSQIQIIAVLMPLVLLGVMYPIFQWLGLWHFAPGSLSKKGTAGVLAGGTVFLGLLLSVLAYQSDTIWRGLLRIAWLGW